ncbi:hypothetical protein FACS1894199_16480 [Bacteroidia bacterium]|nr:hypothetical protein FACS1894199_16480 [Bacteroidia bacterium]
MIKRRFQRKEAGKFDYKPLYYDPEKEEREEREKRIKEELGLVNQVSQDVSDIYVPNIEGKFRNMLKERKEARRGVNGRYAVKMFLILMTVLLLAFYLLSKYDETIFKSFT